MNLGILMVLFSSNMMELRPWKQLITIGMTPGIIPISPILKEFREIHINNNYNINPSRVLELGFIC
jgi:hypothetical protein